MAFNAGITHDFKTTPSDQVVINGGTYDRSFKCTMQEKGSGITHTLSGFARKTEVGYYAFICQFDQVDTRQEVTGLRNGDRIVLI